MVIIVGVKFLFPNVGKNGDEKTEEKAHQEQLCELMYMYKQFHGIIKLKKYVLRGFYKGLRPVMTCVDCNKSNLSNFGSCMCPEAYYQGRLPMTVGQYPNL